MRHILLAAASALLMLTATISHGQQSPTEQSQSTALNPDAPRKVGGDVLPPVLLKSVEPKYPRNQFGKAESGKVIVKIIVDRKGRPREPLIVRSGGDDLDKSAVEAVRHYRFKPATDKGQPVPVQINIEVNFSTTNDLVPGVQR